MRYETEQDLAYLPQDEPECGFNDEYCVHSKYIQTAALFVVAVVIIIIITWHHVAILRSIIHNCH